MDPRQGADLAGIPGDAPPDARVEAQHSLRRGGLPEYRRVLEGKARDGDDSGRGLHPRLHLLQCRDRPPRSARPARAAARRRSGRRAWPQPHCRDLGRPRRSRRWRRGTFRANDRRDPRRRAADDDRGARARFPAQGRRHRDRRRGEARCSQPQSRNRAAALCRGASRRALFPFIALARPREASGPHALHKIRAHGRARRGAH